MKRWLPLALVSFTVASCGQQALEPGASHTATTENSTNGTWTMPARMGAQSLTAGTNTLTYEKALVATSGWGPIEVNRSNGEQNAGDGHALTLNGAVFPKGYGVHAPSELKYSLSGSDGATCTRFRAQVGVDDEVGGRGSVAFQVWGDGTKLYDSGVMTGASATRQVNVDLRGRGSVRLVVTDGGNGRSDDHADWVNPTLTCVPDISIVVPGVTGVYQDRHGAVPITLVNRSKAFTGDLTYRVVSAVNANDTSDRFRLEDQGTHLAGAGSFTRTLNVYMPPNREDTGPLPDALVLSYAGEEVTRAELQVEPTEQRVFIEFPSAPYVLRAGETVTTQARVWAEPGGETTGPDVAFGELNFGQWWQIRGAGVLPKEGGMVPVQLTALRAPQPGEETDLLANYVAYNNVFGYNQHKLQGAVHLQFAP